MTWFVFWAWTSSWQQRRRLQSHCCHQERLRIDWRADCAETRRDSPSAWRTSCPEGFPMAADGGPAPETPWTARACCPPRATCCEWSRYLRRKTRGLRRAAGVGRWGLWQPAGASRALPALRCPAVAGWRRIATFPGNRPVAWFGRFYVQPVCPMWTTLKRTVFV